MVGLLTSLTTHELLRIQINQSSFEINWILLSVKLSIEFKLETMNAATSNNATLAHLKLVKNI